MSKRTDDYEELYDDYEEMEQQEDISAVSLSHNIRNEYIGQGTADDRSRPVYSREAHKVFSSMDYMNENKRVLLINTVAATGSVGAETELTYSPGDNGLKEIREPLPGLGERSGVPVKVSSTDTVISVPETEIEFGIDGNGHLIVSE